MKQTRLWLITTAVLLLSFTPMSASILQFDNWTSTNHGDGSVSSRDYSFYAGNEGTLTFDWQVSSEEGFDELIITLDGNTILEKSGSQSGSYSGTVSQGSHTLRVMYSKDGSAAAGNDQASVRNIVVQTEPLNLSLSNTQLYHITQDHRGSTSWAVGVVDGQYVFKSNVDLGIAVDSSDPRQQFAIVSFDGGNTHYLYSVFAGGFVASDGLPYTWPSAPVTPIYFTDGAYDDTYVMYFDNDHFINVGGSRELSINGWKTADGGNSCTISPVGTFVPSEMHASGTCGESLSWYYQDGRLEISGSGAMTNYTSANDVPWSMFKPYITEVSLPDGLTSIGNEAFRNCQLLTSITIPEGVASIGPAAFANCKVLESVDMPESVRSIGNSAFLQCNSLTSIHIPYGVTELQGYAFQHCRALTQLDIPESVTTIGVAAISNCTNLRSLVIPDNVRIIGNYAFDKSGFEYVVIGAGIESIGSYAFDQCNNLSYVICESVTPPTVANNTFTDASVKVLVSSSAALSAYQSDTRWGSLDCFVGGIGRDGLAWYMDGEELVIRGSGVMADYTDGSPAPWYQHREFIREISIQEGITTIGNRAFRDCVNLTEITIPESVTEIGIASFAGCQSVTSLYIPENVAEIRLDAFINCYDLTSITVDADNPVYDSRNGCNAIIETSSNNLIQGCDNTIIPESVEIIGIAAFWNCHDITTMNIPSSVEIIDSCAFNGCHNLEIIEIPASVTTIGELAFRGTNSLSTIICNVAEPIEITSNVFSNRGACTLFVPRQSYEAYRSAPVWDEFAGIVRIGNEYEVTYMVDGNTLATDYVVAGTTLTTREADEREGYTFGGWYCTTPLSYKTEAIDIASHADAMLYTNAKCTDTRYGDQFQGWDVLFDGDATTIFHSEYADRDSDDGLDHYIRVDLGAEGGISTFTFTYTVRSGSLPYYTPTEIVVEGSNEAGGHGSYTEIAVLKSLPTAQGAVYQSPILGNGEGYRYIRYRVTKTSYNNKVHEHPYFYFAELGMERCTAIPNEEPITEMTMPAKDITFSGSYSINKYLVTFKIGDEVIASDLLEYGAEIVVPEVPEREGHTFSGWSEVPETMPASDVTISGTFTVNQYTVSFVVDGVEFESYTLDFGSPIVAPTVPELEECTFTGWSEIPNTVPAHDVVVEGSYEVNSYLLTYVVDGETVETSTVAYGTAITLREEPSKEGYTFSGWGEVPETMPASDVRISGTFTVNQYTVSFVVDGVEFDSYTLDFGSPIVAPTVPELEGRTFTGWSEIPNTVPARDVVVEGSYEVNSYLLTYVVDGETVETSTVAYGTAITLREEPSKEGYTFSGWGEVPETMPASDVTISGTFTVNQYTVSFVVDGVEFDSYTLDFGSPIVAPEVPELEGHTFTGWSEIPNTVPAHDVVVEGNYTANVYRVFYFVGTNLVHIEKVTYGEAIPEYIYEPTAEGDVFEGWMGETYETMPAHDVTYTANITNGIEQSVNDKDQLTIYDLAGRKVLDTENLKGGIYIINGKKVVIK